MRQLRLSSSPLRALLVTLCGIIIAEVVAMIVVYLLPPLPYTYQVLIDATIMALLIFPLLYLLSFRSLLREIEERKKVASDLTQANEQLRQLQQIVEQSPVIAFRARAQAGWPIEFVSPNVNRLGYSPEDLTSGRVAYVDMIYPDDREAVGAEIAAFTVHGPDQFSHQYRLLTRTGEVRWLDYRTRITRDATGVATHYEGVGLDITEEKEAEEELRRANLELRELSLAEQKQRRRAEVLCDASVALAQSLDLDLVTELALDQVSRLVPFDCAEVILREGEGLLLVRGGRYGCDLGVSSSTFAATAPFNPADFPYVEELLATGRTSCIDDTHDHPGWLSFSGMREPRSWLGVPLMVSGGAIGLFSLQKRESGFFDAEDIQLVEALAGQVAVAMQNAWLFEQVRQSSDRLQALSRRLVEIQESERHYIARELHDEAGQELTSLILMLKLLEERAGKPHCVVDLAQEMQVKVEELVRELHRLARALRPAALDHLGLEAAVRQNAETLSEQYGLAVHFETSGIDGRLPSNVETMLYRVIQEALTNIARHAHATRADVLLKRRNGRLVVVVEDDGVGFEEVQRDRRQGLGLLGMRERAEMLGGELLVESAPGKGTTIVVEVPYDDPGSVGR